MMSASGTRPSHGLKIGQHVTLIPSILRKGVSGRYRIVSLAPDDGHGISYRIKSPEENFVRTAFESELIDVAGDVLPEQPSPSTASQPPKRSAEGAAQARRRRK
jgi:hypothetical protein